MKEATEQMIARLSAQEAPAVKKGDEHPDETALRVIHTELRARFGEPAATELITRFHNFGVVFRMAQWWVEDYGSPTVADLAAEVLRVGPPIDPTP